MFSKEHFPLGAAPGLAIFIYLEILDKFDALPGIQALKKAAIERCGIQAGMSILDDGCGAGLESVRLTRLVGPTGKVIGLDASQAFIAERLRAKFFQPVLSRDRPSAFQNHVISATELQRWQGEINRLLDRDALFCTITYFLVIGRLGA
jgi:SAM-dependent methyltransferase